GGYRVEAQQVELAQQPGRVGGQPPDRDGTADELVPAGALHAVHAQVRAADADGVGRSPGTGRVVLGGDQAVRRIQRYGDGRAQVHVAQPDDEVRRRRHDVEHVGALRQPVDPPDELDVVRAPRRVPAHRGLVPG